MMKDENTKSDGVYKKIVRVKTLSCAVIKCANVDWYKSLLKYIRAQYSYGQDIYPNSVEKAHGMLNKHELLNTPSKKGQS